ncbi:hypothetical protein TNCV_2694061 [Trichonephila clavipes]|nr:hypothetical protein TNCV_2694061 [Trichonephila clavipes]
MRAYGSVSPQTSHWDPNLVAIRHLECLTLNPQSVTDFVRDGVIDNDERVSIPNFDCCLQFNGPGHREAGVAIYRKQNNSHVPTPHIYRQTNGLGIVRNDIEGHMCGRMLI